MALEIEPDLPHREPGVIRDEHDVLAAEVPLELRAHERAMRGVRAEPFEQSEVALLARPQRQRELDRDVSGEASHHAESQTQTVCHRRVT
jgi:hypothetical protein